MRRRNLQVFAERMRAGQDARGARPESTPLFTSADIAKLKPFLSVRTRDEFKNQVWLFGGLYVLGFHLVALLSRRRGVRTDLLLLAAAHLLTAIGFAVLLSRPDPLRDSLLFVRYTETIAVGLGLMAALSLVDVAAMGFVSLSYLPLMAALSLSVLLIFFGSGPGSSSAKVNLGPVQPIEAIRLLLALFLAGYFARRWELLRDVRSEAIRDVRLPAWINLPRVEYVLPVLVGVAAALMFFFFQKDLGPALFLCCVFLAVYAVARGRIGMAVTGLVLLAAGFYVGYRLQVSATLADRVRMWQSPWDNAVARRQSGHPRHLGHGHRRNVRHRPRPRRLALSAGRPHRSHPRGRRRGARRGRPDRRGGTLRRARVARLPHRPARRRATTASFWPRR